jgi:Zn finger protein HypA/HybF involved in hydrogenase expression
LATTRDYDFLVTDPSSGFTTGIEVKTTIGEAIALNPAQVEKDLVVASKGGYAASTGLVVESVAYHAYCSNCIPALLGLQSATLYVNLLLHGIPVTTSQLNLQPTKPNP